MSMKFLFTPGDWCRFRLEVFNSYSFLAARSACSRSRDFLASDSLNRPYSIFRGGLRVRGGLGNADGGAEDWRSLRGGKGIFGSCWNIQLINLAFADVLLNLLLWYCCYWQKTVQCCWYLSYFGRYEKPALSYP